jgi:hypothetical protein
MTRKLEDQFGDVVRDLNRLAEQDERSYGKIEHWIHLIHQARSASRRLQQVVEIAAGLRLTAPRILNHFPNDLESQITKAYHALVKAGQGKLASRIALLSRAGHLEKLDQCEICQHWFLGRRDARTCSGACRQRKTEQQAGFKARRRKWLLETALIPRMQARVGKLAGPENRLRREKWESRLNDYRQELQCIPGASCQPAQADRSRP